MKSKVVLLTGASSGIGKKTAQLLAEKGYNVYGTSRKVEFNNKQKGNIKMIPLDVCDDESVKRAVDYIINKENKIDILINNAGFGIAGSIEDTSILEAKSQLETNFFGAHRMIKEVLPHMRKNGTGKIIIIGSVAGFFSIPFQSMYCAAKYALEGYTEALRLEIKPFGIKACLIEPGDTKTGFTEGRVFVKKANMNSVYETAFKKAIGTMIKDEKNGHDPKEVANIIFKVCKRNNPPIRIVVGFGYKLLRFLKRILPTRIIEFALSKMY